MGNFEDEYPPDSMVDAAIEMLAYKCDLRGLSPISTGFIVSDTIDFISGHRAAPGAATVVGRSVGFSVSPSFFGSG